MEVLYDREVISARMRGLSASVYTQLSDVEQETNGLVTYDRAVVKFDEARMRAINERLILGKPAVAATQSETDEEE